ncbi:MAG: hypothetical protein CV087_19630 [Candidatus Brocadia sp. WS118]|nr:MAG: hypothetical protein CV087_19630 [Candidatus Brocadia sp. WS118]
MDFLGEGIIEMNGIAKQLRYKKDEKGTTKKRRSGNCKVKEKRNLGFIVFNSGTIGGEQIQFFNSRARNQTHEGMAEFMYHSTREEKSAHHFTMNIFYPQSAGCKTQENYQNKTYR